MQTPKISNEELLEMIREGLFFNFCAGMAMNKGYRDVMKTNVKVEFSVGDYDVRLEKQKGCFVLSHRTYVFRFITAYIDQVVFIGDSEEEVIVDLLSEAEKEFKNAA